MILILVNKTRDAMRKKKAIGRPKKSKNMEHTLIFRVTNGAYEKLKEVADKEEVSMAHVVRKLINNFVGQIK